MEHKSDKVVRVASWIYIIIFALSMLDTLLSAGY
jgi:hypothetical protein